MDKYPVYFNLTLYFCLDDTTGSTKDLIMEAQSLERHVSTEIPSTDNHVSMPSIFLFVSFLSVILVLN